MGRFFDQWGYPIKFDSVFVWFAALKSQKMRWSPSKKPTVMDRNPATIKIWQHTILNKHIFSCAKRDKHQGVFKSNKNDKKRKLFFFLNVIMFASNTYGWCTQLDIFFPCYSLWHCFDPPATLEPYNKIVICKYFHTKVTMFFVLHHPLAELSSGDLYYVCN